jgi:hypothetical protein
VRTPKTGWGNIVQFTIAASDSISAPQKPTMFGKSPTL